MIDKLVSPLAAKIFGGWAIVATAGAAFLFVEGLTLKADLAACGKEKAELKADVELQSQAIGFWKDMSDMSQKVATAALDKAKADTIVIREKADQIMLAQPAPGADVCLAALDLMRSNM